MRESWVYKNFAYIYQNPLWNVKIPVGRSVCPYFWSAMWSLCCLRPIIFFITKICIPVMKSCGLGIAPLDKWLINKLFKAFHGEDMSERQQRQTPTGIGVLVMVAFGILAAIITCVTFKIAALPIPNKPSSPAVIWFDWVLATGLIAVGILVVFKFVNNLRDKPSDCKVFRYMWVWAAGALISPFIFIPKLVLGLLTTITAAVCHGLAVAGITIGEFLVYAGTGIGHFFIHWTPIVVMTVLHWLWVLVSFCPMGLPIPWWLYFVAAFVAFLLMDKYMAEYEFKQQEEFVQTHSPAEIRASYRRAWISQIMQCLTTGEHQVEAARLERYLYGYELQAAKLRFHSILQAAVEIYFKDLLNTLEQNYPNTDPSFWCKNGSNQISSIQVKLAELVKPYSSGYYSTNMNAAINTALRPIMSEICESAKFYEEEAKRKIEVKIKRKQSVRYQMCIAFTEKIGDLAESAGCGIGKGFCATWDGICWCWKMFCAFWKNVWTFLCYMFVLLKAKKQKACPYMTFENAPPPTAPVPPAPTAGMEVAN
jgi:hypothetical protein